ncbi:hypothetical protein G6F22_021360 [Rhizopus arrhizus]|nr:hypothetical protein G6F22_021360 [Rhizopus arrhizus]
MCGWRATQVRSTGGMMPVSAVGVAPSRKGPAGRSVSLAAERRSRTSRRMWRARSRMRRPAGVGLTVRPERAISALPTSASSARSRCCTVAGVSPWCRAAWAMDPSSTTWP